MAVHLVSVIYFCTVKGSWFVFSHRYSWRNRNIFLVWRFFRPPAFIAGKGVVSARCTWWAYVAGAVFNGWIFQLPVAVSCWAPVALFVESHIHGSGLNYLSDGAMSAVVIADFRSWYSFSTSFWFSPAYTQYPSSSSENRMSVHSSHRNLSANGTSPSSP